MVKRSVGTIERVDVIKDIIVQCFTMVILRLDHDQQLNHQMAQIFEMHRVALVMRILQKC